MTLVKVCTVADVPEGEVRRFVIGHRPVAVANLGEQGFRAVDSICSHAHYFLDEGETAVPDDVRHAWDALWASLDAGAAALRPGAAGWEVDAAARSALVAAGYPEPMHALGHQLGRSAHDGGTTLAPRWDRYGAAPLGLVEEGNVFTLEYGAAVRGRGYIGLEEDVVLTADGVEWLSTPQREPWLVR